MVKFLNLEFLLQQIKSSDCFKRQRLFSAWHRSSIFGLYRSKSVTLLSFNITNWTLHLNLIRRSLPTYSMSDWLSVTFLNALSIRRYVIWWSRINFEFFIIVSRTGMIDCLMQIEHSCHLVQLLSDKTEAKRQDANYDWEDTEDCIEVLLCWRPVVIDWLDVSGLSCDKLKVMTVAENWVI